MKLYFMKQNAIDHIKANIERLYVNYYKYNTNEWIEDELGYNPFEVFMEIPDFTLAPILDKAGQTELENCKIIFSQLKEISPSQASDERLWAGLCNSTFYDYVRKRHKYPTMKYRNVTSDASAILSRFFYKSGNRAGMFRNSLSKCWWIGYLTYDNGWEKLDAIGPEDFSSKTNEIFYSNTFSSNNQITSGICKALKVYRDKGIDINSKSMLRPSMQYLNAIGGAVLLDMYSEEEIATIVSECIENIRAGKTLDVEVNSLDSEEDDEESFFSEDINIDYLEELSEIEEEANDFDPSSILLETDTVYYGCTVYAHKLPADTDVKFVIPKNDNTNKIYPTMEKLVGMKIGETLKCGIISYTIKSIE